MYSLLFSNKMSIPVCMNSSLKNGCSIGLTLISLSWPLKFEVNHPKKADGRTNILLLLFKRFKRQDRILYKCMQNIGCVIFRFISLLGEFQYVEYIGCVIFQPPILEGNNLFKHVHAHIFGFRIFKRVRLTFLKIRTHSIPYLSISSRRLGIIKQIHTAVLDYCIIM